VALTSYHLPDEEGTVLEPIQPLPNPAIRLIACSARDAEILHIAAELFNFVGKAEEAMALKGLAMAYTLGPDA
jgi:hypothetical protein